MAAVIILIAIGVFMVLMYGILQAQKSNPCLSNVTGCFADKVLGNGITNVDNVIAFLIVVLFAIVIAQLVYNRLHRVQWGS